MSSKEKIFFKNETLKGATHVDLYDKTYFVEQATKKTTAFFTQNLR